MPTQSPYRIEPSDDERAFLNERGRAHTAPYWEVVRTRIVLLASEGLANKEIAARLDTTPQTVCKWLRALLRVGIGWTGGSTSLWQTAALFPRSEDGGQSHRL